LQLDGHHAEVGPVARVRRLEPYGLLERCPGVGGETPSPEKSPEVGMKRRIARSPADRLSQTSLRLRCGARIHRGIRKGVGTLLRLPGGAAQRDKEREGAQRVANR